MFTKKYVEKIKGIFIAVLIVIILISAFLYFLYNWNKMFFWVLIFLIIVYLLYALFLFIKKCINKLRSDPLQNIAA